ncbi:MAG: YdcF family protein [Bacteroidetes bacterium]|nr:YdcF family protein [Bacteroidota bacterium]
MKIRHFFLRFFKFLRIGLVVFGAFCALMLIFSFTTGPFWIYYDLGTANSEITGEPDAIIMLGGGGMPSASTLMRTYHAAFLAQEFSGKKVIIALPGDTLDTSSSIYGIRNDLIIRGIPDSLIFFEPMGKNTRAQALNILNLYPELQKRRVILVTSPEHMYRAVLTFRKAGFEITEGFPAFERAIESDILFKDDKLGGRSYVPDVGQSIQLRYQFWNHLHYEILILRESFALLYYKIKGWI